MSDADLAEQREVGVGADEDEDGVVGERVRRAALVLDVDVALVDLVDFGEGEEAQASPFDLAFERGRAPSA